MASQIVEMSLQGHTVAQIADSLGLDKREIQNILDKNSGIAPKHLSYEYLMRSHKESKDKFEEVQERLNKNEAFIVELIAKGIITENDVKEFFSRRK